MKNIFDEKRARAALEKGFSAAEAVLQDVQKAKKLVGRLERKLNKLAKTRSAVKNALEYVPLFISCLKSYIRREYTAIPFGSMLAIVSALLYWLSLLDFFPDLLPGLGYVDDATVMLTCLQMVKADLDDYKSWQQQAVPEQENVQ